VKKTKTTYLFIGGIFGGLLRQKLVFAYFHDLEKLLLNTHSHINTQFIQNPCWHDVESGAKLIAKKVDKLVWEYNHDVVLVAHSRGSLELLNFLNMYPKLSQHPNIKKIVFGSPLFGKSHMAELLVKYLKYVLPKGIRRALIEVANENLHEEVKSKWQDLADIHQDKCLLIKTSTPNKKHLPLFLRPFYKIIDKHAGENDGVLALSSQTSLLGVQETRFYSNHGAIFCNSKINRIDQVDINDVLSFIYVKSEIKASVKKPTLRLVYSHDDNHLGEVHV